MGPTGTALVKVASWKTPIISRSMAGGDKTEVSCAGIYYPSSLHMQHPSFVIIPARMTQVDSEVPACRIGAAALQRFCMTILYMPDIPAITVPVRKKDCRLHSAVTTRHLSGIYVYNTQDFAPPDRCNHNSSCTA